MERTKISKMTKLRFLDTKRGRHTYMTETYNDDTRRAIRIRLNMETFIKDNYGMRENCILCGKKDSTEHVLTCDKTDNNNITVDNLIQGEKMNEIINMFKRAEELRSKAITDFVYKEIDIHLQTNPEEQSGSL